VKKISVFILAFTMSMLAMVTTSGPAHAAINACDVQLNYDTQVIYKLKNGTSTLSFGNMTVTRAAAYPNRYCVRYSTSGRSVQRLDARADLTLRSDGSCPVPGGYGGVTYPTGTGYSKSIYVAENTCTRLYFHIYSGGKYWTASTYRRNLP
jgi:hypothetical protein